LKLSVATKFDRCAQVVAHLSRDKFQVMPQERGGSPDIISGEMIRDLFPNVPIVPLCRTLINVPTTKMERSALPDEPNSSQMLQPNWIMRCQDELRIGKTFLKEIANLSAMAASAGINTSSRTAKVNDTPHKCRINAKYKRRCSGTETGAWRAPRHRFGFLATFAFQRKLSIIN